MTIGTLSVQEVQFYKEQGYALNKKQVFSQEKMSELTGIF
jgi:hypothetical protein